ncbi:MAG TPA: putative lipid II flippase FtsW [Kineosporiaceae bacterium]|nr:putative lipid II flippase FtsW [Kineosporiaceae bacterium]
MVQVHRGEAGGTGTGAAAAEGGPSPGAVARPGSVAGWLRRLESPVAAYYLVLGATVALTVIGLVMVLSSSSVESLRATGSSYTFFGKQALFAVAGMPAAWIASRLPPRVWAALAWPALAVGIVALLLVFTPLGFAVQGNRNWVAIGGITAQPSEAAKLALVVWGSSVLHHKRPLLGRTSHLLVPLLPGAGLMVLLVLGGHDLGTSMVLMLIAAMLLFAAGAPLRLFLVGAAAAGTLLALLISVSPNRTGRLEAWMHDGGCTDYYGSCWQSVHGTWALATGSWWGVGLGASRQKWSWLPEAHNDFIFAIVGEELGLAGTLAVLLLFAALGFGLFRLVQASDEFAVKVATAGVFAWVLGQAVINIAGVLGLLPVIGVPLPLLSSGGSALLTTLVALGMVLGFARRVPGARAVLAVRPAVLARSRAVLPNRRT